VKRQLNTSASVVLDGSGNGEVRLGPQIAKLRYRIRVVGVQIPGTFNEIPTAKVYNGLAHAANFISGTYDGNNDSDTALDILLFTGQFITVRWEGGPPGFTATANIVGEELTGVDL
jgi:hypothetical protein